MYSFRNDYSEGAHPQVLQALMDTNLEQTCGYGLDPRCKKAADLIRDLCEAPEADIHFLVGGTQTNQIVIASLPRLRSLSMCSSFCALSSSNPRRIRTVKSFMLSPPGGAVSLSSAVIQRWYSGMLLSCS